MGAVRINGRGSPVSVSDRSTQLNTETSKLDTELDEFVLGYSQFGLAPELVRPVPAMRSTLAPTHFISPSLQIRLNGNTISLRYVMVAQRTDANACRQRPTRACGLYARRTPVTESGFFSSSALTSQLTRPVAPHNLAVTLSFPPGPCRIASALSVVRQSVRTLRPLEVGGPNARRGFAVQDHVAAAWCLKMCEQPGLLEVWCESQDDITAYWDLGGGLEEVEFVQVKSDRLNQLWSASLLLSASAWNGADGAIGDGDGKAKAKRPQKCILEKSLQLDRGREKSKFRLVTCRPIMDELKILTYAFDSPHRAVTTAEYIELSTKVKEKLSKFRSENGNNWEYWLQRTMWEVIHEEDPIENKNILKVISLAQGYGIVLLPDQARSVYERLLTRVNQAGKADWDTELEKKHFKNAEFVTWFNQAAYNAAHPSKSGGGKTLEDKLNEAKVAEDVIETARSLRLAYLGKLFTPRYSEPDKREELQNEIDAKLMSLRAKIDSGELDVDGRAFHIQCMSAIDEVHDALPKKNRPPASNLYGFMYELADRCTHRFVRAE